MADTVTPPATGEPAAPETTPPQPGPVVPAGAENPDAVRNAIQRERDAAKEAKGRADELAARADELARKVQEFEDRDKSDMERVTGERDTLKQERDRAVAESLRLQVAIDKALPPELVDRLRGSTKEELEADADQLLALVKPKGPGVEDFDGGARRPAKAGDLDAQIAAAEGKGEWDEVRRLNLQKLAKAKNKE